MQDRLVSWRECHTLAASDITQLTSACRCASESIRCGATRSLERIGYRVAKMNET
jgi:hypothetical protein